MLVIWWARGTKWRAEYRLLRFKCNILEDNEKWLPVRRCTVKVCFHTARVWAFWASVSILIIYILSLSKCCGKHSIFHCSMLCWNDLLITLHKPIFHATGELKRQTAHCADPLLISLMDTNTGAQLKHKDMLIPPPASPDHTWIFPCLLYCEALSSCRSALCLRIFPLHKSNAAPSCPPRIKTHRAVHTQPYLSMLAVILLAT